MRTKTPREMDPIDSAFSALADRTRLRVLCLLQRGEICVGDLVEILQIPQPRASQHLAYLRRAGLVKVRKDGLWSHYSLARSGDRLHRKLFDCLEDWFGQLPEIKADRARADRLRKTGGCCPH